MRKIILLITVLVFSFTLSISAFAQENDEAKISDASVVSESTPVEAPVIDRSLCVHNYTNWEAAGDVHSHVCTICGKTESEGHIWNSGIFTVEPTCRTDGEVRYSCIHCVYDKIEVAPATGVHTYKNAQQVDGETHILTCPGCQDTKIEAHTWNGGHQYPPATCASEGQMEYRCTQCTAYKHEVIPKSTIHTYSAWGGDEFTHTRNCTTCGNVESGSHSWYGGAVILAPTCNEAGVMGYLCTGCDMALLEEIPMRTTHLYDNDCDSTCNSCGLKRETSHKYATTYTQSATGHWYACTACGDKKDTSPHIPGPAATATSDQTCNACGYVLRSRQNHTHDYQKTLSANADGHWYACSGCTMQKDFKAHSYDNSCDADCNVCGYVNKSAHTYDGTWQTDEKGHWAICTVCNVESTHTAHIPGPEADETNPQICTTCSYILTPVQEHKHSGGDEWQTDDDKHWKVCECGEIIDEAIHVWDEGTENDDSTIIFTCKDCSLSRSEEASTIETSVATASTEETSIASSTEPEIPENKQHSSILVFVIFVVIVIALVGAIVALVMVLKPKKRGRFTK